MNAGKGVPISQLLQRNKWDPKQNILRISLKLFR